MPQKEKLVNGKETKLTDFGRRVLMRQVMLSRNGDVGVDRLAQDLGVRVPTVWQMLRTTEPDWWKKSDWIDVSARLCQLLRVDHSWLFSTIDYGDLGALRFDLQRRETWNL